MANGNGLASIEHVVVLGWAGGHPLPPARALL
jgi:hypothetical protein